MSLDYILVKYTTPAKSLEELESDPNFSISDYCKLGETLFSNLSWASDNSSFVLLTDVSIEIHANNESLSLGLRGTGNISSIIEMIAARCKALSIAVIDVQTSELFNSGHTIDDTNYFEWYKGIILGGDS